MRMFAKRSEANSLLRKGKLTFSLLRTYSNQAHVSWVAYLIRFAHQISSFTLNLISRSKNSGRTDGGTLLCFETEPSFETAVRRYID